MSRRKLQPTADAMRAQLALAADEIIRLREALPRPGQVFVVPAGSESAAALHWHRVRPITEASTRRLRWAWLGGFGFGIAAGIALAKVLA